MAEWLKAHAWKACIPQGIQGSNPCLSATPSLLLSKLLERHGSGAAGVQGICESSAITSLGICSPAVAHS